MQSHTRDGVGFGMPAFWQSPQGVDARNRAEAEEHAS